MKAGIVDFSVGILCPDDETAVSRLFAERITEGVVHFGLFSRPSVDGIVKVEGSKTAGFSSTTPVHDARNSEDGQHEEEQHCRERESTSSFLGDILNGTDERTNLGLTGTLEGVEVTDTFLLLSATSIDGTRQTELFRTAGVVLAFVRQNWLSLLMVDSDCHRGCDLLHDLLHILSCEFVDRVDTIILPVGVVDTVLEHGHGEWMTEVVVTMKNSLHIFAPVVTRED